MRIPRSLPPLAAAAAALILQVLPAAAVSYPELVDPHPAPSNRFGTAIVPLTNGNIVVTAPWDDAGGTDAGAVYLFDGSTGALLSTLLGGSPNDHVGSGGVVALPNGNFVVTSPDWDNGATVQAGAVTWRSGTGGSSGPVSAANSLVGTLPGDGIGLGAPTVLATGNYVVSNYLWDDGALPDVGAVTWCDGATGRSGVVSSANSLVGSAAQDYVGLSGAKALPNGNYVVSSAGWHSATGAVTWGSGTTGITGVVSATNSLVGQVPGDAVGGNIVVLPSSNYVAASPTWSNGAVANVGAVTWCSGSGGAVGTLSPANSFVGSNVSDQVGSAPILVLANGNFVVRSPSWDDGATTDAGAVTLGSGTSGLVGVPSAANSLVGANPGDHAGSGIAVALTNGNFVVTSPNAVVGLQPQYGAITWGHGVLGVTGPITVANSLTVSSISDLSVVIVTPLANGNYVVGLPSWSGLAASGGAATFGNGTTGTSGVVSASNSLVGSSANDRVGSQITGLTNGNYVVASSYWSNGPNGSVGAATWGSGSAGVTGPVSAANSLVGSTAGDQVGGYGVIPLASGHFVVRSPNWDLGSIANAGAVTFGYGVGGVTGAISPSNSLVGSSPNDLVGANAVAALPSGDYVIASSNWDNGSLANVGAVTWCRSDGSTTGLVSPINSLVGVQSADNLGNAGITVLKSGAYVVNSSVWRNGALASAGAATWGPGTVPMVGTVASSNSLVGTSVASNIQPAVEDTLHGTFLCAFLGDGSGHVRVGPRAFPTPVSLVDVPGDQGGWLRLTFARGGLDLPGATPPITQYGIWRRVPGALLAKMRESDGPWLDAGAGKAPRLGNTTLLPGAWEREGRLYATGLPGSSGYDVTLPAGTWELVASLPALQQPQYVAGVPTISNAAADEYVITAHTTLPAFWYPSASISGQSVDNLAPAVPVSFVAAYSNGATQMQWAANAENDLGGYRLYRGSSAGFVPSIANRIASPATTQYADAGPAGSYYKLSATDVNGNESAYALVTPTGTTGAESGALAFALDGFGTNPARFGSLRVSFALPDASPARLELLDVSGRRVIAREVGTLGAGRHSVDLGASAGMTSGVYWLRLTQGPRERRIRVTLLQ